MGELKEMLLEGVYINLDNEQEIEKVATIFRTLPNTRMKEHDAQIGLRINPLVGSGTIAATSTATANSKFGLPWTEATHEKIYEFFEKYSWLQGVHVHVGSQGCPLELLVIGAKKAVDFVKKINQRLGKKQIKIIDIGGGLPTIYDGISKIEQANDFEVYAKALEKQVHELFTGEFQVITEFGRSLFVKPGMTISKVEAVKNWGETNQPIAVIHVGANQFLRTAYLPKVWPHQLSVFTKEGKLKKKDFLSQDIAGPLCFSGDFIARKVFLPRIEVGDYLVIHDTGGYTLSMYSKYNSRCASSVFAYIDEDCKDTKDTKDFKDFKDFKDSKDSKDSNKALMKFAMLKERETVTQTLAFWGNQAVDVHLLFS
jgi:diaminopimelate decarboxylase